MTAKKELTLSIAKKFLEDENAVDVSDFNCITVEAAEAFAKHKGDDLSLEGLTSLSDSHSSPLVLADDLFRHQTGVNVLWSRPLIVSSECKVYPAVARSTATAAAVVPGAVRSPGGAWSWGGEGGD